MVAQSDIGIVLVLPEILGTYGDAGNGEVLLRRALWRGHRARLLRPTHPADIPENGDIYVIGGGEDAPQALAARELAQCPAFLHGLDNGAVLLAVCAGFQILGRRFPGSDGTAVDGLGLFACETTPGTTRCIGEVVAEVGPPLSLPPLTGYENHAGVTVLDAGARPLARVVSGGGNDGRGGEGILDGHRVGTYLHGPVLARNPALADRLLEWVAGPLDAIDDHLVDDLRRRRLAAVPVPRRPSWARNVRGRRRTYS